jgi:flagellum-specific peptidoglycan hydrolase FlgJ
MSRKMKFKRVLLCALLISLPLLSMTNVKNSDEKTDGNEVEMCYNDLDTSFNTTIINDSIFFNKMVQNTKDSIKNEIIDEVEKYVYSIAPKTKKNIPSSIVENGLFHGIDIMFMVAQTQIETTFGTMGAGREISRRSLFGVAIRKYDSYEKAIDDYCRLLKKSYLIKGRTEQHLMRKYTTTGGGRYAGNPNYEVELRKTYLTINRNTKIKELQEKYNSL